jgi:hypothetical protein
MSKKQAKQVNIIYFSKQEIYLSGVLKANNLRQNQIKGLFFYRTLGFLSSFKILINFSKVKIQFS